MRTSKRVDTHLHIWTLEHRGSWLTPRIEPLFRDFTVDEARGASRAAGFDSAILVQAADSDADTRALLAIAAAAEWVDGVVGWVPLDDADGTRRRLDTIAAQGPTGGRLLGVRALIHDIGDPAFLAREPVRRTLQVLGTHGLPLDIPDAWPEILPHATSAAAAQDNLVIVLDHLGKPPATMAELGPWRRDLVAFAHLENTVAKVSGLHHGGRLLSGAALRYAWDTALEVFGPGRLMLGSDWPMPLLGDGAAAASRQLTDLLGELSKTERAELESRTAERVYRTGSGR